MSQIKVKKKGNRIKIKPKRKIAKRVIDIVSKRLQYIIPSEFIRTKLGYDLESTVTKSKDLIKIESETNRVLFNELGLPSDTGVQVGSIKGVGPGQIGFIPIDRLANHNTLFFRTHTPRINDLLFNIILFKYPILVEQPDNEIFQTKKAEIFENLAQNEEVLNILRNNANLEDINFQKIAKVVNLVSNLMGFNILVISNSVKASNKKKMAGAEFGEDLENITKKDLAILYMYVKGNMHHFEPITGFDRADKTRHLIIAKEKQNILKYIQDLLNEVLSPNAKVKIVPKRKKKIVPRRQISEKILFNPYDKNSELPLIELNIDGNKTTFLLGHKVDNYHIIYEDDKVDNSIAGKIILDDNTKTCEVSWCQGFPK